MDRIRVGIEVFLPIQRCPILSTADSSGLSTSSELFSERSPGFPDRGCSPLASAFLGRAFFECGIFLSSLSHHLFQFYPR